MPLTLNAGFIAAPRHTVLSRYYHAGRSFSTPPALHHRLEALMISPMIRDACAQERASTASHILRRFSARKTAWLKRRFNAARRARPARQPPSATGAIADTYAQQSWDCHDDGKEPPSRYYILSSREPTLAALFSRQNIRH